MNRITEIDRMQNRILESISGIRTMMQGSINEIYNSNKRKDGTVTKNGPYYTLTRNEGSGPTKNKRDKKRSSRPVH